MSLARRYHAWMRVPLAITLDLDDTVWPIGPVIARAELALHAWLETHAPATARRWPVDAMRGLRERIGRERTDLAHDFTEQRRLVLAHALADSGDDVALAGDAFDAFFAARNAVECYPDAIDALARLAKRVPVAALTNGNADLAAIGLHGHFAFCLCARGVVDLLDQPRRPCLAAGRRAAGPGVRDAWCAGGLAGAPVRRTTTGPPPSRR